MKHSKLLFAAAAAALLLSSCDMVLNTKNCRCYELTDGRWTGPTTEVASPSRQCSSFNTASLLCNEMDEPILDPSEIAVGKKK